MQSDQPTRRKMLATIATVAAGASVTALPALAVNGDHDTELFALERELKAAHARMEKACELTNETAERSYGNRPPQPERPEMPEEYAKMYEAMTVGEVSPLRKVRPDHPIVIWRNETEATFKARRPSDPYGGQTQLRRSRMLRARTAERRVCSCPSRDGKSDGARSSFEPRLIARGRGRTHPELFRDGVRTQRLLERRDIGEEVLNVLATEAHVRHGWMRIGDKSG
jgi:hypothetical protein